MTEPIPDRLRHNFVAGAWATATGSRTNVNPADLADPLGEFAESTAAEATAAIDAAWAARTGWEAVGPIERAAIVRRAARLIEAEAETFAAAITREQGKRLGDARGEVERALAIMEFIAGEGRRLNGITTPAEEPRTLALTFRRPIGVVGLITPWNFPLAIPVWKVAPALVAGCTAVLKPSPLTPLTAALLVDAFDRAGVPAGVLNLVQGDRDPGAALVDDHRVAGISFTGSLPVGQAINTAGAERLLRTQLELGGKNAVIVLADADLDAAATAIVHGAFGQSGQRCSATSRVIVDRSVKEELLRRVVDRATGLRVGPGGSDGTDLGPVINDVRRDACLDAVDRAVTAGATVRCGGGSARVQRDGRPVDGFYVEPTVLSEVDRDSELAQEEIFGPVLAVIDCDGFDQAVEISNSVRYGMSATIFTTDQAAMFQALNVLDAGMLHVNRPGVGAYAHLPHLGAKASQLGAAECSPDTWNFYTDLRTACIRY
ncbi:aldehyde dehydrogenase family protein [Microlunatus speluncae]|uniref:aldehyde dehydrogenase family protein n=1 Tax=Microlunatus speluncae TaxID=2594267 RepID=UPI00126636B5|nr:aldehyde dehydrogenase family protein [Microlunatus speluncae]